MSVVVVASRPAPVMGGPSWSSAESTTRPSTPACARMASPSPTLGLVDDVIEGMSASTQSIFERDVEHSDPMRLPLTAHDAVDLAIAPVLDEAVSILSLSTQLSSSMDASTIITAVPSDPTQLVIEHVGEVLATGGTGGATSRWLSQSSSTTLPSSTISSNSSVQDRPIPSSGIWSQCQYQPFSSPLLADSSTNLELSSDVSPPTSVASFPPSSSMSDPSSPRSLSPTGSTSYSSHMTTNALIESTSSLNLNKLNGDNAAAVSRGRLSFLSYADVINAERVVVDGCDSSFSLP